MNYVLEHHGVKGMKWGVRKDVVNSSGKIIGETKNLNRAVNGIRSANKLKKQNIKAMSDQELRDKVNRMNLEQQFIQLSSNQISRGHTYLDNALTVAGSTLAITSSALSIAMAIKKLKE